MAAAVLSPPQLPTGSTLGPEAASQLQLQSPDAYRRELMIEYALAEYSYVMTEDEADEIFDHPDWWEDVDAFVEYMQEVNSFGTGRADVALPSTLRVYTDAELDAMEETGDFYPPALSVSSDSEEEEEHEFEDEEEPLPLYELHPQGESLPAKAPPTYMESVDAIFAALGQEVEMLRLVHRDDDHHPEEQPQQPEVLEEEEEEPEDEQLDALSRWLGTLNLVPTTPRASIEVAAAAEEEEEEEVAEIVDTSLPPLSPVVLATHEAVQVTMAVATPALVVVARPPQPIAPPATTRRGRFSRRVRKVKDTLSRGLKAISCSSSSSA